jgi:hypothetical protein
MSCHRKREIIQNTVTAGMQRAFIYSTTDAWLACRSILDDWSIYGDVLKTYTTDKCTERMTNNNGEWNPAWMNDPCCNHMKRMEQCCAPRAVSETLSVVRD